MQEVSLLYAMFLQLNHQQLDIYKVARVFVKECYRATAPFPPEEKFALTQQIRRAALSVFLNIAEGYSRSSTVERKRFFEISRGSINEVDAALDIASDLGYCKEEQMKELGNYTVRTYQMLSRLISS
jgi:four helix bundle protein